MNGASCLVFLCVYVLLLFVRSFACNYISVGFRTVMLLNYYYYYYYYYY
jgi:hypothetical protein